MNENHATEALIARLQPDEAELDRRRALRDRRTHDLVELVARRRELAGVNPWADHLIEGVAWTA